VTLAYTTQDKEAETLARIHVVGDTVRSAQGLVASRFYRGRGTTPCYVVLTTWEDEETWKRAQERYNPKQLLLGSAAELLAASPEQWQLSYLWGYSRPAASPIIAAIHLAIVRPEQADLVQRGWVEGLRRQVVQPTLAFAFLSRGINDDESTPTPPLLNTSKVNISVIEQGSTFLNLLSWSSEEERERFYSDLDYQAVNRFVTSMGVVEILPLEPI